MFHPFLQRGESQLAGVADEHHAPGHTHDGVGLFPWLQGDHAVCGLCVLIFDASLSIFRLDHLPPSADLREGVRAWYFYRVGIPPRLENASALFSADAQLFWQVVCGILAGGI